MRSLQESVYVCPSVSPVALVKKDPLQMVASVVPFAVTGEGRMDYKTWLFAATCASIKDGVHCY